LGIGWAAEGAIAIWGERSLSVLAFSSPAQGDHALKGSLAARGSKDLLIQDHSPLPKQSPV